MQDPSSHRPVESREGLEARGPQGAGEEVRVLTISFN